METAVLKSSVVPQGRAETKSSFLQQIEIRFRIGKVIQRNDFTFWGVFVAIIGQLDFCQINYLSVFPVLTVSNWRQSKVLVLSYPPVSP